MALNQCQDLQPARLGSKQIENDRMIPKSVKRYVGLSLQTIAICTPEVNKTIDPTVPSLFVLT